MEQSIFLDSPHSLLRIVTSEAIWVHVEECRSQFGGDSYWNIDGITISGSKFESNIATGDRGCGGALYMHSCAVAISECTFVLNVAVPGSGGALLYMVQLGRTRLSLVITGCTIKPAPVEGQFRCSKSP